MPADLVLTGGRVWSHGRGTFGSMAIEGGRISAVADAVAGHIGPATAVVDLDGRFVCPGFQDAHVHPAHGGRALLTCNLLDAETVAEGLARIEAYSAGSQGWVTGSGWKYEWFARGEPPAGLLDSVTGDKPAYLTVADGHSGWANTAALEAAGVEDTTPDPRDGRIVRLPDGRPQGTLHEGAMALVERALPPETEESIERALLAGQNHLFSHGVTAWQDAAVSPQLHRAYVRLAEDGRLRASVRGALWWERGGDLAQLDAIRERSMESAGSYRADAVKLMLDGVVENFTARMLEPYLDAGGVPTGQAGIDMLDPDTLPAVVTAIISAGLQPHFHAIGDGAVRLALDSVEQAWADVGRVDARPHIAHLQVVHPDDIGRFGALGVVPNLQPLWAVNDSAMTDLTVPYLGEERSARQYPFADLAVAAGRVAMGSDWPVSTSNVMDQLSVAIRRRPPLDDRMAPFLPEQALSVEQAFAGFTAGSAWVNGLDSLRGTLEPGKIADLVILSDDPRRVADPAAVQVSATLVAGEAVFGRL